MNDARDITQVSPKYRLDRKTLKIFSIDGKNSFDDFENEDAARLIFADRMQGWFFDPARELVSKDQSIAAVHIVTPLIESLAIYKQGKSSSRQSEIFFTNSAKDIFSLGDSDTKKLRILYKQVRCGFAHQGFFQDSEIKEDGKTVKYSYNIAIAEGGETEAIVLNEQEMIIYIDRYIDAIEKAFKQFYKDIEDDKKTRDNFLKIWKQHWSLKSVPRGRKQGQVGSSKSSTLKQL